MPHVQAIRLAADAVLRAATFRRWYAEKWAAFVAAFTFERREERRRCEQLRRTYADLISRLIEPGADEFARRNLENRLLTIDLSELQTLHAECLQVAGERAPSPRRAPPRATSRDALWDLTPLLK